MAGFIALSGTVSSYGRSGILWEAWEGLSEGVENQGADEAFKAGDQLGLGWCCE